MYGKNNKINVKCHTNFSQIRFIHGHVINHKTTTARGK